MSSRLSFWLSISIIFIALVLRLWDLPSLPAGLSDEEIVDIRITETIRDGGGISVFYDLGTEGREGFYHATLATLTTFIGNGTLGYRMISLWAGIITVALVYAIGIRLFGRFAGLSAMAFMAFGFAPIVFSRHITPEVFLPLQLSAVLLALAQALPTYRRRQKRTINTTIFASLGVFSTLGLYVHPIGIPILILVVIYMLYMSRYADQLISKRRLRYIRFSMTLMAIMAIPYFTSTIRRPNLHGFNRLFDDGAITLQNMLDSVTSLVTTGDSNPLYNLLDRPLLDPFSAGLIVLALIICIREWRQPRYGLLIMSVVLLLPTALFTNDAPHFTRYLVLLPIFALLFGLAIHRITSSPYLNKTSTRLVTIGFIALIGANLGWATNDLFNKWRDDEAVQTAYNTRLGQLALHIDQHATEIPMVVCGWSPDQSPSASQLTQAQIIDLMLNRDNAPIRYTECNRGITMTNGGAEQQILLPNPDVIETTHPLVREWFDLATPLTDTNDNLPDDAVLIFDDVDTLADRLGVFTVSRPIRFAPETGNASDEIEEFGPPISLGGNITFLGYESVDEGAYDPSSTLTIATYWRADGEVPPDLHIFVHILADPAASPVANFDTISVTPSRLRDRDVFVQITYVTIPETLPAGEYQVSVGAYQDSSNIRLEVLEDGTPRGDRLFLYTIEVAELNTQENTD